MKYKKDILKNYKFIKADIVRLKDLIIDADNGERLKLEKQIREKERAIARVDNALTVLNKREEYIIRATLLNGMSISEVGEILHLSDRSIYSIRYKAFKKMDKYLG